MKTVWDIIKTEEFRRRHMNKGFSLLLLIIAGSLFADFLRSCSQTVLLIAGLSWMFLILTGYVAKLKR